MRREFLKGYIMSIAAEGGFSGLSGPIAIGRKVLAVCVLDLAAVGGEFADIASKNTSSRVQAAVLGKAVDIIRDIDTRGVRAVASDLKGLWQGMQAQYKRGMDVNAANAAASKKP